LLPSFFSQTLAGGSTPFDAGRSLFPVYMLSTLPTLYPEFVGEYLYLGTAAGAFVNSYFQISRILTGAMADHSSPPWMHF
jgi:hypothetical protein